VFGLSFRLSTGVSVELRWRVKVAQRATIGVEKRNNNKTSVKFCRRQKLALAGRLPHPRLQLAWARRYDSYPPAIAPMIRNGSAPEAITSGSGASGDSCDQSSSHA